MGITAGQLLRAIHDAGVTAAEWCRIGDPDDRLTWKVFYDGTQTPTDEATAQTVIDTIAPDSDAVLDPEIDGRLVDEHAVIALREALFDGLGVAPADRVAIRGDHRTRYRALVKGS